MLDSRSSTPLTHTDDAVSPKKRTIQLKGDDTGAAGTPQPQESEAAALNRRTIEDLQDVLRDDPEADLQDVFPKDYARRMRIAGGPSTALVDKAETPILRDFREKLDNSREPTVLFPLSSEVTSLLNNYEHNDKSRHPLLASLKKLVWDSPKLWESPTRGVVVKCSDQVVAKVVTGTGDYTEYSALRHLEEKLPDIPAPRPYGLIEFKPFRAVFMSYIPSMTLEDAWPKLNHESKSSVRSQLEDILQRLRSHTQETGLPLGGLGGEGVKDWRWGDRPYPTPVDSAKELEDVQFSAQNVGSKSYATFLRQFLAGLASGSAVLTHGDLRKANIMVELDNDHCIVKGIIDWEESGFYPEFFESFNMTRTLSVVDEDDWFLYLPEPVSPFKFPVRWLVDWLWNFMVQPF